MTVTKRSRAGASPRAATAVIDELYRSWQRGREPDDVVAYLRTAVLNAARTALRGRARRQALVRAAQPDPPVWSAEAAVMADEDGRAVLAAVASLPRRQREVFSLRYFLDLSEKQIAATLGISRCEHDRGPAPERLRIRRADGPSRVAALTGPTAGRPPSIEVVSAATGRIVARLPAPGARTGWSQATAGQGGRQFLLAATDDDNACRSLRFYLLMLSGTGKVASLRPYSAPKTGQMLGSNNWGSGGLAASADGSTFAYVTTNCASPGASQEMITVIRHGTVRTWSSSVLANPAGLSLSADGSLLGYVDQTNATSATSRGSAWILRTDSAPGPADQRARKVFTDQLHGGPEAQGTVLGPDGSTMYLLTAAFDARGNLLAYAVSAYDTATGARLRTLHTWHGHRLVMPPGLVASGDRALIWYLHGTSVDEVNLVSGAAATYRGLQVSQYPAVDIAW